MAGDGHLRLSYNDVHIAIKEAAVKIKAEFNPSLFIAIGGGGFIPARILRTFCKYDAGGKKRNIPIQAIGLTLYEAMGDTSAEVAGTEVVRTQWLDFSTLGNLFNHGGLLGRRILVVDEVDDSRRTLAYTMKELLTDVEQQLELIQDLAERERLRKETVFGIFVVHNKLKPKDAEIPDSVAYFSCADIGDIWVDYPWEMSDILEHDRLKEEQAAEEAAGKA